MIRIPLERVKASQACKTWIFGRSVRIVEAGSYWRKRRQLLVPHFSIDRRDFTKCPEHSFIKNGEDAFLMTKSLTPRHQIEFEIYERPIDRPAGPSPLGRAVKKLLDILGTCDPNAQEERHPEWPLQLRGDEDAVHELVAALNEVDKLCKEDHER